MGGFRTLIKWTIIVALLIFLIGFWLNSKKYLFSDKYVASIARKYDSSKSPDATHKYDVKKAFKLVHAEFLRRHPGHILEEKDLQWVFMNAGGWMGAMCLLHASLTEYVLFFGAAVETQGHSGRYWANITDTILTGEFVQWKEGELGVHTFKAGDTVYHPIGEATEVNFKADTWMVEYGRGFIPSTLTFALADTFFSTTDFVTLFYILKVYAKALVMEAGYYVAHANELFA